MKKIKQLFAFIAVIIIIGLVFLTLYCAVTGSPYFMASLIAMFFVPILLYSYMFIYRLLKGNEGDNDINQNDKSK